MHQNVTVTVTIRPADEPDARALCELLVRNRDYFSTGEPVLPDSYYTPAYQAQVIERDHASRAAGTGAMFLIETEGVLVGRLNLSSVIRGAFQSASVAYLVDQGHTGRGIATSALGQLVTYAFDDLGLHRLQAEVLPSNTASKRVLAHLDFVHYGTAPEYLLIQGQWQTHDLFQLINSASR